MVKVIVLDPQEGLLKVTYLKNDVESFDSILGNFGDRIEISPKFSETNIFAYASMQVPRSVPISAKVVSEETGSVLFNLRGKLILHYVTNAGYVKDLTDYQLNLIMQNIIPTNNNSELQYLYYIQA